MSSNPAGGGASPAASPQPFFYTPVKGETGHSVGGPSLPSSAPVADKSGVPPFGTYEKGLSDGEARAKAAYEKMLVEVRAQVAAALAEFKSQREVYFEKVEAEVVQLALSIARKILHREVQIDPLLLAGVVRVALDGLQEGTEVRLRTNPDDIRFWSGYFGSGNEIMRAPELVGDPSLPAGQCVLETEMGTTHIGLETQLKEIEQGFLDLLEQRPRVQG